MQYETDLKEHQIMGIIIIAAAILCLVGVMISIVELCYVGILAICIASIRGMTTPAVKVKDK